MPSEYVQISVGVLALLAYIAKLVMPYLMKKLDERDETIMVLTEKFTDTINHKQTAMTEALDKLTAVSERQAEAVELQTELFKSLIPDRRRKK